MKKVIILLGVPGSGKGTQARKIATRNNYAHISTGELCRALALDSHVTPEELAELALMKEGRLVSDKIVFPLAYTAMEKAWRERDGIVLDGAPRNVAQAEKLEEYFKEKKLTDEVVVIEIRLTDKSSFERMTKRKVCPQCKYILPYSPQNEKISLCPQCGGELMVRPDDNPETVQKRIKEQGNSVVGPIAQYYADRGVLNSIDGEMPIAQVEEKIKKILGE
ncbi:MAG TPA: nucleoside monophosphate kinase [Candidatus Magasanikbacteria bacterium]|nr:nucleoside monophosphate kinase [Candidatus Magasanikbacteria bacterium]